MKQRPVERLEKTLARVAKEQGLAQERLRDSGSCSNGIAGAVSRSVPESK